MNSNPVLTDYLIKNTPMISEVLTHAMKDFAALNKDSYSVDTSDIIGVSAHDVTQLSSKLAAFCRLMANHRIEELHDARNDLTKQAVMTLVSTLNLCSMLIDCASIENKKAFENDAFLGLGRSYMENPSKIN